MDPHLVKELVSLALGAVVFAALFALLWRLYGRTALSWRLVAIATVVWAVVFTLLQQTQFLHALFSL
jgi:hypothetical protein